MNIAKIRENFPIFKRPSTLSATPRHSLPLVYLDSAATSQKPQAVIDAISHFYSNSYATVHRALYQLGELATTAYENARSKVARFINASSTSEIIFTKGTTESINFIAQAWAISTLKKDDEIVLTHAEHHANLLPWQRVVQQTGAKLVFIPIDKKTYQLIDPLSYLNKKTKLVAVTHSSNVLGPVWSLNDSLLKKFIEQAHIFGARVMLDAAQSIAHQKLDVQTLNPDFMAFSGHKMFGPTGIGILYIKKELHHEVQPYQLGGSMVFEVFYDHASWAESPQKFEAGTPPIAGAIGLGAAIDYITENIDFAQLKAHEASLCQKLITGLTAIPDITIIGNQTLLAQQGHLVSFSVNDIHAHDIATLLGEKGIALRAGHHCAQPLINELGFQSLLRVSVAVYNTPEDIEIFLQELQSCLNLLKSALQ